MKQVVTILMLGLLAGLTGCASAPWAHGKFTRTHAVIQVSENSLYKWNTALNNAQNLQEVWGKDNVTIEIVAYGAGLKMLLADSKVAPRLNAALDNSVELAACATSMKKQKITKADLAGGVTVVPGGVVEIMRRQSEGWAYIKP